MTALALVLVGLVVFGVIAARHGTGTPRSASISAGTAAKALAGSPRPLASLHAEANRVLPGGTKAFKARLKALRGHPVVINEWASWCEPCQSEFPVFQRVAVRFGRRVAFVGVDSHDQAAAATAFLHRFPVAYPSYADPNQAIGRFLEAVGGIPQTIYLDAHGRSQFDHAGPYETAAALEKDIRRYVLR